MLSDLVDIDSSVCVVARKDTTNETGRDLVLEHGPEPGGNNHVRVRCGIRIIGAGQVFLGRFGREGFDGSLEPWGMLGVVFVHDSERKVRQKLQ